jgi:hypothetical protein
MLQNPIATNPGAAKEIQGMRHTIVKIVLTTVPHLMFIMGKTFRTMSDTARGTL